MKVSVKILFYCYYTQMSLKKNNFKQTASALRVHTRNECIMYMNHETGWEKSRLSLVYVRRENNKYLKI